MILKWHKLFVGWIWMFFFVFFLSELKKLVLGGP